MTVSKASLDQTFVHAVHCATDAGLNTEGWTLEHGSRANGVSYVLSNGLGRMRGKARRHPGRSVCHPSGNGPSMADDHGGAHTAGRGEGEGRSSCSAL